MPTITIPKKLRKPLITEDVAIIPRKQYEELMREKNNRKPITIKRTMRVPKKYKKFYEEVDQELT